MKKQDVAVAALATVFVASVLTAWIASSRDPRTVLVIGDSIVAGKEFKAEMRRLLPHTAVEVRAYVGEKASRILGRIAEEGFEPSEADVTVVAAGANDLIAGEGWRGVVQSLELIHGTLLEFHAYRCLIVPPLPFKGHEYASDSDVTNLSKVCNVLKMEYGPQVIDMPSLDRRRELPRRMDNGDHLHLSRAGQRELAAAIAAAVRRK